MKIRAGQIYIQVGAAYPFSFIFQRWLSRALSLRVQESEEFRNKFGEGFELIFRISAKSEIEEPDFAGPTVFKKDKDVEFTIFLPFRPGNYHDPKEAVCIVRLLLGAIAEVLPLLRLDPLEVISDVDLLCTEFLSTPGMLEERR